MLFISFSILFTSFYQNFNKKPEKNGPLKKKKAHRWPKRAQVQRAQEQEAHRWLNQIPYQVTL